MKVSQLEADLRTFADKEDGRYALSGVYFDRDRSAVTDGRMLVVALRNEPLDGEPRIISSAALAQAQKAATRRGEIEMENGTFKTRTPKKITINGVGAEPDTITMPATKLDGTFPEYDDVFQKGWKKGAEDKSIWISVDPAMLKRVCELAMRYAGSEYGACYGALKIGITAGDEPMHFGFHTNTDKHFGAFGVLMPVTVPSEPGYPRPAVWPPEPDPLTPDPEADQCA